MWVAFACTCIWLARTIYIRCIYGIYGWEITKYTVIYGVYIQFWPTLHMQDGCVCCEHRSLLQLPNQMDTQIAWLWHVAKN